MMDILDAGSLYLLLLGFALGSAVLCMLCIATKHELPESVRMNLFVLLVLLAVAGGFAVVALALMALLMVLGWI